MAAGVVSGLGLTTAGRAHIRCLARIVFPRPLVPEYVVFTRMSFKASQALVQSNHAKHLNAALARTLRYRDVEGVVVLLIR